MDIYCASSVAIGCYVAVLHALNYMNKDLLLVAKDDEFGRKLQDLGLPVRKRVVKKKGTKNGGTADVKR